MERHVGPRAILTSFFWLQERPRALQEGSKRLSEGFRVEDRIRTPFWTHFGGLKREPGTSKIIKILARVVKNQGFAILSLDRFGTSILGPSRAPFGRVFGPQAMRNQSPWCPWAGQEPIPILVIRLQEPPRAVQEASQSVPRGLQEAKALQEASRELLLSRLDSILHPSGFPLGPFVHSFWTPGGSAK